MKDKLIGAMIMVGLALFIVGVVAFAMYRILPRDGKPVHSDPTRLPGEIRY